MRARLRWRLHRVLLCGVVGGWVAGGGGVGWSQTDDFNDGNDAGWSRYSPLTPFGAPAVYSFPNGTYRISSPSSPDAAALGPARAGSFRSTQYSRVNVAVDLVAWDTTVDEVAGLLAYVSEVGLGTTDGYAIDYHPFSGNLHLILVIDERPVVTLMERKAALAPGIPYRLVFTGAPGDLLGQVFFKDNLTVPVASVFSPDTSYGQGQVGLFGFSQSGTSGFDATFDNFEAKVADTLRATVTAVSPRPEEQPAAPIEAVTVELRDRETLVDPSSVQLEVDGARVTPWVDQGFGLVTLTYYAPTPLPETVRHRVKLSFSDGQGPQSATWGFGPPAPPATKLLVAPSVSGPFAEDTAAAWDEAAKTFTSPRPAGTRFYQLESDMARRILGIAVAAQQVVVRYE
ncbi:MAG: hypothetical protein FJ387_09210 [Verrucomicrobia bacterium]|nr:hypothetical protein [Verrucomicrobiota bacterium]